MQIARVCHDANRAWQVATGDPAVSPGWDEAPEWQRDAAVDGVRQALRGASAEELHESWLEFKRADGWTYGAVKDGAARTHPCLVPYAELPPEQRQKDTLFGAIVAALSGRAEDI
ncbi:RyR domain-containing protein [Streptomyces anulatus]|uniref:RyR domain-containing protein n=1 Tax=Streptomyces anulatus TaxID=1892 RepID=UPI00341D0422